MYRFSDNQLTFSDFGQPVGMKMNAENRWVKKAELIPWDENREALCGAFQEQEG